jgi:predicted phage terminase large subunit-like protein
MEVPLRRFHYSVGIRKVQEAVLARVPHFGPKFAWFIERGYRPHPFQIAFHTLCHPDGILLRFRMLVAGRRGGKTLSAAWEVAYYCLNPEAFHWDAHREVSDESLHVWILVPNFKSSGRAAMRTLQKVLKEAGCTAGVEYKWNRGENFIEFANGTFVEFKTAEQADNLVGAGIHILWMDEAAIIPNQDAYDYASPALDDNMGIVIGTTTPRGKNWFFKLFWSDDAQEDDDIGTVEYRSIDNPFFPKKAWLYRLKTYHPLRFKQEFMAAFDSMAGKALSGEWLQYYETEDIPLHDPKLGHYVKTADGQLRPRYENFALDYYIGIDPAIAVTDSADRFAVAVIGVPKEKSGIVYVLDVIATKISFPDQLQLIEELHIKWRPHYFGIESVAYQAALAQQAARLPGLPPIIPVMSRAKKEQRIMAMSPLFKLGKVLIRSEFKDFIDEWLMYDPEMKNPSDDTLDAMEIALGTAGIILPGLPQNPDQKPAGSIDELAERFRRDIEQSTEMRGVDETLGAEW